MNPSRTAISAKIGALDPARFQALVEEYAQIHFPGRFQNLQRRGSNIKGETTAGWPDGYATTPDSRLDILEVTRANAWHRHLQEDIQKASATQFAGRIAGFVFVAWARTPDPTVSLKFHSNLNQLGIPKNHIALVFQEQLVSDLCQAKFALLWQKYLDLPAHCLPFQLIENAPIYGSAHQTNIFTPTKEEYAEGVVHRPDLTSQVEQHLNDHSWALVRGKGASGKTVMAIQIAMGGTFRTAPTYYLDIASLVSTNQPDSSSALDVITSRRDQGVLFIVDNIHLDEQMAREILEYWQSAPAGSFLLLLGRWTEPGPNPRGTAAPLGHIDHEALRLEVGEADLLGVLGRLAARSGLRDKIRTPPAEIVEGWLSLFGGDLIAFSAAVVLNIRRMAVGEWKLTADDAKEYVRSTYLYPYSPLTDDELHNLLLIATLSKLEFAVSYAALKRGDLRRSLRTGLVHRFEYGRGKFVQFRLVHPGFGELLLAAAYPHVEEKILYQEFALAAPSQAVVLALRLEKLGQRDVAETIVHSLVGKESSLRAALLNREACNWMVGTCDLLQRLGGQSFEDIDNALCSNPGSLAMAAVKTPLHYLVHFLAYANERLPKSYAVIASSFTDPNNLAKLLDAALQNPLDQLTPFLDYCHGHEQFEPIYRAAVTALTNPSNVSKVVETSLRSPLDHLTSFLGYAELKLPNVYGAIAKALADPRNLPHLVESVLRAPFGHIVSFFRLSLNKEQLQDIPTKVIADIEQPVWDRIRLENPPEQPDYVHAASGLFHQLGRPELMVAPAQVAIIKAEASYWHAPGIGIHHLGQVMRHGHAVDQDAIQRFLRVVVTDSWLKEQYASATAGAIAACLFGIWTYYSESIVNHFLTGALARRLAMELGSLTHLDERELAGAISLFGCCSLMVARLPVSPKRPPPERIQGMLKFFEAQFPADQLRIAIVLLWLGLREISRLMPNEIQVPCETGKSVLAMWRNAQTNLERHLRLNSVMISWLDRCSGSGWRLFREQNSVFEELAREATKSFS